MKFSVLLPTRNRLKYLKYAVESVLAQDYDQWEIVISDNFSSENISEYIDSLNDSRIKYFRTEKFVSVTENWNNTIDRCSGDYVIMLGDDDILLKDYFSTMKRLIKEYNTPNLIYANAYIYTYPGVIPQHPKGLLHTCANYPVFDNATEPFWLTKKMALRLVEGHLNFNAHFGTNMQYILMKNSVIDKIKTENQFFYSPYPDVYAMNVMMLEIENILIYPKESVVIGVTPKSTGNFLINNKEKQGMDFLNISNELNSIQHLSSIIMPGSPSLTSWLIAMETVKMQLKNKYHLSVNYTRYRYLQIENLVKGLFSKSNKTKKFNEVFTVTSLKEKIVFLFPLLFSHFIKRFVPSRLKRACGKLYDKLFSLSCVKGTKFIEEEFSNILQIFDQQENGKLYFRTQLEKLIEEMKTGTPLDELCKIHGISLTFFQKWEKKMKHSKLSTNDKIELLENKIDKLLKLVQDKSDVVL